MGDGLSAIVLAAGYSSRMGSFKPLLDLGGRTFLERAAGAFRTVGIDDVAVVTGHHGDEVGAAAEALGVRVIPNPDFARGMYSSVRAGVAALPASTKRFFLLPVDCALVRPETIGRLARAGAAGGPDVVVPAFGGRTGHPPLLDAALRAEVLAADPQDGLRGLLAGHAAQTRVIEVDDRGVGIDADTPADLGQARRIARSESLPREDRCRALLSELGASPHVAAHSLAVTGVAASLTTALNESDQHLCLPLVVAGALLHDIARAQPHHDAVGAALLDQLGYPRVAALVRRHMDLGGASRREVGDTGEDLGEAEVLYLADKLVIGERIVTIEERFAHRLHDFDGEPEALAAIHRRLDLALSVRERVERVLERPLEPACHASPRLARGCRPL